MNPNKINKKVDAWVKYRSEAVDYWQTPRETMDRREGDCDDIAILKLSMLINNGYKDCWIERCWTEENIGHMVCVVNLWYGERILDNGTDKLLKRKNLNYLWGGKESNTWDWEAVTERFKSQPVQYWKDGKEPEMGDLEG